MDNKNYIKEIIGKIDLYLINSLSKKEISAWALKIIITKEWDALPSNIKEALHVLFDLHDEYEKWVPRKDELLKLKEYLTNYE